VTTYMPAIGANTKIPGAKYSGLSVWESSSYYVVYTQIITAERQVGGGYLQMMGGPYFPIYMRTSDI